MTCLSYSALLWAAVQLIPRVFVSIFTADASLINFTAPMLRIYLGGLFLFGIQIACQMTFTSLGKAVNSIVVAVVRKFVLLLPLIYIMPHVVSNPTTGVYMAEPIADIIAVLFTSVLFTSTNQKLYCYGSRNLLHCFFHKVLFLYFINIRKFLNRGYAKAA